MPALPESCARFYNPDVGALVQALEAGTPALGGCARLRRLHESPLLSVDLWRCVEDGEGLRAERCHTAAVLTVCLSGAGVLQAAGRAMLIEAGTALLTPGDLPYRSAHPLGCGDMGCHVRPSPRLLRHLRLPVSRCATAPLAAATYLGFRRAVERAASGSSDGLELEEASLSLFAVAPVLRALEEEPGTKRRHAELVEETKALLFRRFAERLCLDEVAGALNVSPYHLARLFRRHTGLSIHGYRTRVRLAHALDRLEEARGALTELALELGFSSHSHFTDVFRRAFGAPPGAVAVAPRVPFTWAPTPLPGPDSSPRRRQLHPERRGRLREPGPGGGAGL
jgi:AraC-like DNA-binding protein